jgi:hypothetical protein
LPRSTRPSQFGKRTEEARTKIAPQTKEALRVKWRDLGYSSESDYLADAIEIAVHGLDSVLRVHEARLKRIAGIGRE